MPKRRVTAKQKAASRRNLVKARMARSRYRGKRQQIQRNVMLFGSPVESVRRQPPRRSSNRGALGAMEATQNTNRRKAWQEALHRRYR